MLDDRRLLRRVTLSLAGRLPTEAENGRRRREGARRRCRALLDAVMKEDAFYDRLREGFNDIFLTLGVDGNAGRDGPVLRALREDAALVPEARPEPHRRREGRGRRPRYKLADDYRKALLGEPMKLVEHIVRNDRPFTEIVTADYIMVSPYTARGYGIFDEVKAKFKNPDDPFEYIPVKLKALIGRSKATEPGLGDRLLPARRAAEHVPVPAPLPDDRDEPQPPAGADVLPALPRRRRAGAGRPRLRRRRGHGEVRDPDDAGLGVRRLPQDARPGRRAVPGLLRLRGRLRPAQGRLVQGHVRRRLRGRGPAGRRSAGGRCSGSASARRRTRASPSRWSSTSTTSSPAARCCCRRRTSTTRSTPPSVGPTRSSAARSRRSPRASPRPASTSRTSSRTGSSPTSTAPTASRPRSTTRSAGRSWTTSASCGCSRRSRSSGRWTPSSASAGAG